MEQFERDGFAMTSPLLQAAELAELIGLIESNTSQDRLRGGVRDVMHRVPSLNAIANHKNVRMIVGQVLGPDAFAVRATLFDKTPDSNWKVPWHQDVTIAVDSRTDVEGYGPWSMKEGVTHVQPPSSVLQRMVTVRIHLDPCPASNGALRVLPGSHRLGRIYQKEASNFVSEKEAVVCEAKAGETLVMRPLLLHSSSTADRPAHRRVLHFDFAYGELASGLQWKLR